MQADLAAGLTATSWTPLTTLHTEHLRDPSPVFETEQLALQARGENPVTFQSIYLMHLHTPLYRTRQHQRGTLLQAPHLPRFPRTGFSGEARRNDTKQDKGSGTKLPATYGALPAASRDPT